MNMILIPPVFNCQTTNYGCLNLAIVRQLIFVKPDELLIIWANGNEQKIYGEVDVKAILQTWQQAQEKFITPSVSSELSQEIISQIQTANSREMLYLISALCRILAADLAEDVKNLQDFIPAHLSFDDKLKIIKFMLNELQLSKT
ncbi:MAG TPA: hypothetical protein VK184_16350 [Nostocaceae cyanobacterium]|nr:hypothetical protein [Nostocaceae cyanobacterium]